MKLKLMKLLFKKEVKDYEDIIKYLNEQVTDLVVENIKKEKEYRKTIDKYALDAESDNEIMREYQNDIKTFRELIDILDEENKKLKKENEMLTMIIQAMKLYE